MRPSPRAMEAITRAIKHGWCFTPLNGKKPIEERWPELATNDPARLDEIARQYPNANFGLVCGPRSGVCVLDVDRKSGGHDTLAALEQRYGMLPATPQALTGSGGEHYYFRYLAEIQLGNSAGLLGPGLDVKATNGQVVFPPGIHPETRREYVWEAAHHPDDLPLAPLPTWIIELLKPSPTKTKFVCPSVIPESTRQDTLFRLVRSLKCEGKLDDEEIADLIRSRNQRRCQPPLEEKELEDTIVHALSYPDRPDFNGHANQDARDEGASD